MASTPDLSQFKQRVVGRSISENSWPEYKRWITRFEQWLSMQSISDPNIGDLEAFDGFLADESRTGYPWVNARSGQPPAAYAYRSRVTAVSAAKKWVRRHYTRRIPETPGDICIGAPEPFDPTYLSPQTIDDTFASAGSDCDIDGCEAALRLSYDAILRASELVAVERDDIDLDAGTVYVRATKGSQNLEVGLAEPTVDALTQHVAAYPQREYPFWNSYGRSWRASAWVMHVLRNHCDAGSHAFGRHSPILHRLEAGQDFGEVYRRARHQNPTTTIAYARIAGVDVPEWAGQQ